MRRFGESSLGKMGARLGLVLLPLLLVQCSGTSSEGSWGQQEIQRVQQRLAGRWRLLSFRPDERLSPALFLSMQSDKIVVRFDHGRMRSDSDFLEFDRAYRISDVNGDLFTLVIFDDVGVAYRSLCRRGAAGKIHFTTVTAPWRGRGVLAREGLPIRSTP